MLLDNVSISATFVSSTLLTAIAGPHSAGPVDVVVTNPDGRASRLERGFTYVVFGPVASANMIALQAPAAPPNSATDPLIGRFTLDIDVPPTSAGCEAVPPHARRRTYTADIHPFRDYYAVKLYDATFLRDHAPIGYGCFDRRLEMGGVCHQFILTRSGESSVSVVMQPEDEWRGSEIWEVVIEDGRLLQVYGQASGSFDAGRIVAAGSGGVWYGNGLPATQLSACRSEETTWTFTRR